MKTYTAETAGKCYHHQCLDRQDCPKCFPISISRVRKLVEGVEKTLSEHAKAYVCKTHWGYNCTKIAQDKADELSLYLRVLSNLEQSIEQGVKPCLTEQEFRKLWDKVQGIVYEPACLESFSSLKVDRSGLSDHLVDNPLCYPREKWDRFASKYCTEVLGIDPLSVEVIETITGILFEVRADLIPTRSIQAVLEAAYQAPCRQFFNIPAGDYSGNYIYVEMESNKTTCELGANFMAKSFEDCKLAFSVLTKKIDCKIDFKTFAKVLSCGYSLDFIAHLESCNIQVSAESKFSEGCLLLVNARGLKVETCSIKDWDTSTIKNLTS